MSTRSLQPGRDSLWEKWAESLSSSSYYCNRPSLNLSYSFSYSPIFIAQLCIVSVFKGNHAASSSSCMAASAWALAMNSSGSGTPSTRSCWAMVRICRQRSSSSRLNSKEANSTQGAGTPGNFSQYFSQMVRTLSSCPRRSSISTQALKTFSLGKSPMARPQARRASSNSQHLSRKLAQKIHSFPKVNLEWGTSLIALCHTRLAAAGSSAPSSSNTAQLYQMYMYLRQQRFSSAGGRCCTAASQASRVLSGRPRLSSRKSRLSQASQLRGFLAMRSLQMPLLSPSTTSSISSLLPCSFSKFRYSAYSFWAASLGTCLSPNLKICRARSYSRILISNLAKSRKYCCCSASAPSSVITRSQMPRAASLLRLRNSNLATFRQVSRWGQASRQRQSTCLARAGSAMRSSNLKQLIQAFSGGHQSIQRSKMARALGQSPMSSSMQAYLNQNWSYRGRQQTARSQTLRAWLTNLFFISISAYLSQSDLLVQSISRARSNTDRDRLNSFRFSSHCPYRTQIDRLYRCRRSLSSNSRRFSCLYTCSSFSSMIRCTGGRSEMGRWISASFRIWSAVICTSAASLFLIGGGFISIIVIFSYNLLILYRTAHGSEGGG